MQINKQINEKNIRSELTTQETITVNEYRVTEKVNKMAETKLKHRVINCNTKKYLKNKPILPEFVSRNYYINIRKSHTSSNK